MGQYSCKKATEMVEKRSITGLTISESLKLKFHLSICKACRAYQKQSELIDAFFENNDGQNSELEIIENNELKTSIITRLKD